MSTQRSYTYRSHHKNNHRNMQHSNDYTGIMLQQRAHHRRSHLVIYLKSDTRPRDTVSTILAGANTTANDIDQGRTNLRRASIITPKYDIKRCYLFLKVLIRLIEFQSQEQRQQYGISSPDDPNPYNDSMHLLRQIKAIISRCIVRHRSMKGNNNMSLRETIVLHVRDIDGIEYYWNLTRDYLGYDTLSNNKEDYIFLLQKQSRYNPTIYLTPFGCIATRKLGRKCDKIKTKQQPPNSFKTFLRQVSI